jgi:hypothetical protein
MSHNSTRFTLGQAGILLTGFTFAACSGGGSGGGSFSVSALSVQPNATVQINRPIEIKFSEPVDFSSVNLNTISITQVGGAPAAGEFRYKSVKVNPNDPCSAVAVLQDTIVFQPACPTLDDYSDAGLTPGGFQYQLNIVGSSSDGLTVRSTGGKKLGASQTLNFVTPVSTDASVLFVDPAVNTAPRALIADPNCTSSTTVSYIELGGDDTNRVDFVKRDPPVTALGADVEVADFKAPLNLYSDAASRVVIVLQIDQPVNPSSTNVNANTVLLQYLEDEANPGVDASWKSVPHTVTLAVNCTVTGAVLRVIPTGILPQGRQIRVALTPDFRDITGNGNILTTVVGSFRARTATDPGTTNPGLTADGITEPFTVGGTAAGSNQDTTALLDAPPAEWANEGQLKATFNFGGTGGPGGAFVYRVRAQSSGTTVFLTTFQSITNEDSTLTEPCVGGQIDVKDFIVDSGATFEIRGPNPCVIRASGRVDINGRIFLRGANSRGVVSYSTANLPENGATGNAGGGRGGTGSPLATQSDPKGESGFGAFGLINGGGRGGESSVSTASGRPGGGGGGSFAVDQPRFISATQLNQACPEQSIIGLDAEDGSNGQAGVTGALSGVAPPKGGLKGPRPFTNLNPVDPVTAALDDDTGAPTSALFHIDDFWGSLLIGQTIIKGELANPWAGAGGGAGGDVVASTSFPATPFNPATDKKGAGGGGGGGSLTILCLGNIKFGSAGRIDASGGTGGGGENTSGVNRIGGGSGGGSGGHVVLQAGNNIDFALCVPGVATSNYSTGAGIFARGGEGGEGANGAGGTNPPSIENAPNLDMLPPNHYPNTTAPCGVVLAAQGGPNTVGTIDCAGGDGGPGIIQLHVSALNKIIVPGGTTKISNIVRPNPIGTTPLNTDTPLLWRQLLPIFGRSSKAVSKWIPLGATSVPPTGTTPKPITFFTAGTNPATGLVTSMSGSVPELPPILSAAIATSPTLPYIAADGRSILFDATGITDDVYIRNAALVKNFVLRIAGATTKRFEITSATYDATANTLRVFVADSGAPLAALTGTAAIIPRFFRVSEDGQFDKLSSTSSIKIEYQATTAAASGLPNETAATPWVTDINALNTTTTPANTALRFFRFRVAFEIGIGQPSLDFNTPTPGLDFLRIPFKF